MSDRTVLAAEPFAERINSVRDSLSVSTYRFGYRVGRTKDILSAVEIPADTVELAITADLFLSARMSPTGDLFAVIVGPSESTAMGAGRAVESVEHLVARAVDAENLRLEESGPNDLKILLARLERSVTFVKGALAQFRKTS